LENQIERGTIMIKQRIAPAVARMGVVSLIGIGVGIAAAQSSLASDYRHQKAAQCQTLVAAKGLKGDSSKAEYHKCMADPVNYK
jgi:hypothetical protein